MTYGAPYKGSKSKIAPEIIEALPGGNRLVDLFGGGFAITHCAMVRPEQKWNEYLYNDIRKPIVQMIQNAINGYYNEDKFRPCFITKNDFFRLKDNDGYIQCCWSFGNDQRTYCYAIDIMPMKEIIHNYIVFNQRPDEFTKLFPNTDEYVTADTYHFQARRLQWMKYCKVNDKSVNDNRLKNLEALGRLNRLCRLNQLTNVDCLQTICESYQNYEYHYGDIVYCDIPYEDSNKAKHEYGTDFNHKEFYQWAREQSYDVYFSSYLNEKFLSWCDVIWKKEINSQMGTGNKASRIECLYKVKK